MAQNVEHSFSVKLPWQESQWQHLDKLYRNKTLPHALLLVGPDGIGKYRFAQAFAHYVMCVSPRSSMACGQCRQCGFNLAGTHPDLKHVEPEEKGKQIKIDQVRALVEALAQTSQQGGYKVSILSPAEAMNINAANSLLKSLEEPTADTLLILLADSPSQLLPTIRSRCQSVVFPVPAKDEALAWLAALLPSSEQAEQLLQEAQGRPIAALELLETDGIGRYKQMRSDFMALLAGRITALTLADKWLEYDLLEVLSWLNRSVSSVVSFRVAGSPLAKEWQAVAAHANVQGLFSALDNITQLHGQLAKGANPNKQLALEELLLETCDVFHT